MGKYLDIFGSFVCTCLLEEITAGVRYCFSHKCLNGILLSDNLKLASWKNNTIAMWLFGISCQIPNTIFDI